MTVAQRLAMVLGLLLFAGIGLYPPWRVMTGTAIPQAGGRTYSSIDGGFSWIVSPPRLPFSAALFYARQTDDSHAAALELADNPEFYRFSVADRQALLTATNKEFRELSDSDKQWVVGDLDRRWRERGPSAYGRLATSRMALLWAPRVDVIRLVLIWLIITALTAGTILVLGFRSLRRLQAVSHGQMEGDHEGWQPGRIYRLKDGRQFYQVGPTSTVKDLPDYCPQVTIYRAGPHWYLGLNGSGDTVEVRQVRVELPRKAGSGVQR